MRAPSHWSCLDMARLMLSARIPSPALFTTTTRLIPEIRATCATKASFSSKAPSTPNPASDTGRPSAVPPSSPTRTFDGGDRKNARSARASSGPGKGKADNGKYQPRNQPLDHSPESQGRGPGQEERARDTVNKPNDRFTTSQDSSAFVRNNSRNNNNDNQQGSFKKGNKAPPRPRPPQRNMPTTFRTIPATERIESLDKQAVQELFTKRAGAVSVVNDAFSIKAAPMPFRKPPPPDIPLFVQKAMREHDKAVAKYKAELQEFQQRLSSSTLPDQIAPTPPKPPQPMIQYKLANRRQYPETIDSPHSPFRVSFMTSKKVVSKLATDRNLVRKKLVAAAEMVFRGDNPGATTTAADPETVSTGITTTTTTTTPTLAREGYEYLIFPKRAVMWTTQEKLMELMVKTLQNPKLYGERDTPKSSKSTSTQKSPKNGRETPGSVYLDQPDALAEAAAKEEHDKKMIEDPAIKFRWKYNRPPTLEPFWKHSLPNPLSRVHQSNAYLNRFCPDAQEALGSLRQQAGRQRKAAASYQRKRQQCQSKRSSDQAIGYHIGPLSQ